MDNFFFEKQEFLKNGYGYNLHQSIPLEKLHQNQLLAEDNSFFPQTRISVRSELRSS